MNKYLEAVVLGVIQGLTEFLPVSSSGHLALAGFLGIGEGGYFFNLMLHLGTLIAVCFYFRKTLVRLLKHPLQRTNLCLLIASVPTAVAAFIIRFYIEETIELLPFCFLVTTGFLLAAQFCRKGDSDIGYLNSLVIGTAQGLACFTGISRSGATIATAILLGTDRAKAGEFSFLLSVPIILGSSLAECLSISGRGEIEFIPIALGMIVSFLCGMVAIKGFLGVVKRGNFLPFAIYTFALSIASFALIFS